MGIPSYFSYIIKNHANIIRTHHFIQNIAKVNFHSLYMDCNSIIYDAVRKAETEPDHNPSGDTAKFEDRIISQVIQQIHKYVEIIRPSNVLYIAFDGVAPFAKMEQQRTRRYKTSFMASLDFETNMRKTSAQMKAAVSSKWNTAAITPGTAFMELLSAKVEYAFSDPQYKTKYGIRTVVVSPSTQRGEGEHKMFEYLRDHPAKHETVAVYGLDADLIMLSVVHLHYCYNIHIFREAPHFSRSVLPANMRVGENELLFLNTHKLSKHLLENMGCREYERRRLLDYIFLCFFLGNDFLPHFPALNLRTKGIYALMDVYAKLIGAFPSRSFVDDKTLAIQWNWVHLFITECAKHEHQWIKEEYVSRNQLAKMTFPTKSAEDRANLFENIPILMRGDELYVCPEETYWEERYYKVAFHENRPTFVKSLCVNYLEGLEWVFKYYTQGCPHWRWKYNYHYPPLLVDLAKYLPLHSKEFIDPNVGNNRAFPPHVQLAYVIPNTQHHLLPKQIQAKLAKYECLFPNLEDVEFVWMGCRYFWEAHAALPKIPMEILENWEREFVV